MVESKKDPERNKRMFAETIATKLIKDRDLKLFSGKSYEQAVKAILANNRHQKTQIDDGATEAQLLSLTMTAFNVTVREAATKLITNKYDVIPSEQRPEMIELVVKAIGNQ